MGHGSERVLHWFRNDLRLQDNQSLACAADRARELVLLFVLDDRLLASSALGAPRLRFLLGSLGRLRDALAARGQTLVVRRGDPVEVVPRLARELRVDRVSWNRNVSPYARRRDSAVERELADQDVAFDTHKDHVVFESDEIRTREGQPFRVFTPFRNAWWERFASDGPPCAARLRLPPPVRIAGDPLPTAAELGFEDESAALPTPGEEAAERRLEAFLERAVARYAVDRDRPDLDGTSRLSPYLRFGAISIRRCVHAARERSRAEPRVREGARKWLDELVWREFYQAILAEYPHVLTRAFRPAFDAIEWEDDEAGFRAWCDGRTGFPFVDAAMRQLAQTGWIHNRARMAAASFLVKDLGIDWRRGERFFFQRLVDGDPASNNGGWQWTASTGTDAQPYFRIFHPVTQGEKFDPEGTYVRRFVPELRALPDEFVHRPWQAPSPPGDYPAPILDHGERRARTLQRFAAAREPGGSRNAERESKATRGRTPRNLSLF